MASIPFGQLAQAPKLLAARCPDWRSQIVGKIPKCTDCTRQPRLNSPFLPGRKWPRLLQSTCTSPIVWHWPKPVNFLCPHQRRRKRRPNRIPMSRPSFPQNPGRDRGQQTTMPFCPRCPTQSPLFLARLDQLNTTLKWPFPRRKWIW